MRIVWVLRLILFAGVCAFLVCGCSSGKGGTSISPPLTEGFSPDPVFVGSDNVPRDPAITGDLGEVEPLLGWRFTEPADLLDEGWAGEPATIATSLSVSAVLHGTAAEDFDGNVDFHVDGESYPFQFGGSVLTAQVSGLTVGPHQFWVHAIGPGAWASRSLEFEVVNEAPFMQIGVGADDGMLYANLSRRMPKDYLGNLGAWELTGFPCNAVKAEALADGASARIYLSQPLDLDGLWWGQIGDAKAHFQSPLGECEARLIPAHDDTGGERKGQTEGCDQGEVYDCDPEEICCAYPLEWEIECEHRHPLGKEPRQALTCENWADGYRHGDGNWTPPWRNCFDLIVVRHNWIGEAHSNYTLPGSFNLSGDQLWENPLNMGYSGIGYMMGVWQYYYRDFSYYPNSGCPYAFMTLWVDCYNCGGDPPGYKSKGWQVESPLIVDHTNPVFDGIEVIYGAEINDYVGDVLIPDLQSRGIVYTPDNQTGDAAYLYTRYMELVGEAIDDDDVVLVVKAQDPLDAGSDQGSWLHDFIGIDFVNENGQFGYIDDAWEDLFHVDEPPCASQERTSEYWPKCTAGNLWWDEGPPPDLHLHTDGYGQGEYSCWVAPIPCEWFSYQGAKLRIRDDVNNWTHSDNLAPGEDPIFEVQSEPDAVADCGSQVLFEAQSGNSIYEGLLSHVRWFVLKNPGASNEEELDAGAYQAARCAREFHSEISGPWEGPMFTIEKLWDDELCVRAKIVLCGEPISADDCIGADCSFEVVELMFMGPTREWDDFDAKTFVQGRVVECEDGHVQIRPDGSVSLNLYALVIGPEGDAPEYLQAKLSAPSQDLPPPSTENSIDNYYLYRLARGSTNADFTYQQILDSFQYAGGEPEDEWHIYCRGSNVLVWDNVTCAFAPVTVPCAAATDAHLTQGPTAPEDISTQPFLYVSSRDDGIEGGTDCRDFAIAYGLDVPATTADVGILVEQKLSPKRGKYDVLPCEDPAEGQNLKYNVLTFGMQNVVAACGLLSAQIPVESEADILFLLSHGDVQWVSADRGYAESYFKGFEPPANTPESDRDNRIFSGDFAGDYLPQVDAKYIISPACWILAKEESYPYLIWPPEGWTCFPAWKELIVESPSLLAICGHVRYHEDQGDDEVEGFWTPLIDRIKSGDYQLNDDLWQCEPSSDYVVICYMQTAAEYCSKFAWWKYRKSAAKRADVISFGAIDATNRYHLWYVGEQQTVIKNDQ